MCNLIEPPARSLYTTIGPGGRRASTSRITENMEFILPPERRIKSEKSNDGGGCLDMGCCTIGCPVGGILSLSGLSSCSCGSSSSSLESSYPVNRIDVIMEFILRICRLKYAQYAEYAEYDQYVVLNMLTICTICRICRICNMTNMSNMQIPNSIWTPPLFI
jgi:hypothetical protein